MGRSDVGALHGVWHSAASTGAQGNAPPNGKGVVVIGAGPAGLSAAYELVRLGMTPHVVEGLHKVGGLSRTEEHAGYRFDLGGHRFLTRMPQIQRLWDEMLGPDLLTVHRQSRIYYGERFYRYPLQAWDTFSGLGPLESARILGSYLHARISPPDGDASFEQWVTRRFGARLYETFFKTYTEKVWGIPCSELRADWAAQRIKGLSLVTAVVGALGLGVNAKTLADHFQYPRLGPGMMWERFADAVQAGGGQVALGARVSEVVIRGGRVDHLLVENAQGAQRLPCHALISSMPLDDLVRALRPAAPAHVQAAAQRLSHRAFAIVQLALDRPHVFPHHWIYIHDPRVRVGRIQNFGNWSPALLPGPDKTSLGLEYFCSQGDDLWSLSDDAMIALAAHEIEALGLAEPGWIESATVVRHAKAYPIYDATFGQSVEVIRAHLRDIENLQTIGRSGMHRYNNLDHSMLTGILAARNLAGAEHDVWQINADHQGEVG
jgi:protoporphyrinogen oxidase